MNFQSIIMKEKKKKLIKKDYKKAPLSKVHLRVMTSIALGQFTCGFALGITGVAMSNAAKYIQISDMWTGLIGAGGLIGLSSSALIGRISDKIGRSQLLMSICASRSFASSSADNQPFFNIFN